MTIWVLALILCSSSFTGTGAYIYAASSPPAPAAGQVTTETTGTIPSAKRQNVGNYDVTFRALVRTDKRLPSSSRPRDLLARGARNSVKLSWSAPSGSAAIDGYVILRKDTTGERWRQIAAVAGNVNSYKDTAATVKDLQYKYSVVSYRVVDGVRMVTVPVRWAGAVSSNSTKQNVKRFTLRNSARVTTVKAGVTKKIALNFSYTDPVSTTIRWTSSNPSIASVDGKGVVTGVRRGTVTLTGMTHTGDCFSMSMSVIDAGTAQAMVDVMSTWINFSEVNNKYKGIIDIYNSKKPWPRGYKVKYSDEWCATCVSAAALMSGTVKYTGRECGVPQFITYFKERGRWEEDCSVRPEPGDLIIYGWSIGANITVFGNNWSASHIGVVESVKGSKITVIEGNMGIGTVGRRTINQGWRFIRGYCRPKYKK